MNLRQHVKGFASALAIVFGLGQTNLVLGGDVIFYGGPILTMDSTQPSVEALAVRDGRLLAVGSLTEVSAAANPDAEKKDLAGRTLLPGFVDSHSHAGFMGLQAMSANMLPRPDGSANDVAEIQAILTRYIDSAPALIQKLGWVIGFGYDDSHCGRATSDPA